MTDYANRIRERRIELGLTREETAEKTGITRQQISGIESGHQTSLRTICKLAKALETSADELLGREKYPASGKTMKRHCLNAMRECDKLGISYQAIRQWPMGVNPQLATAIIVADYYKIPIDELYMEGDK